MAPSSPLFDAWLQNCLQKQYDEMLAQPLPAELLRLLSDGKDGAVS